MNLIYRIAVRILIVISILLLFWTGLFYYTMVDEIRDEADDALEDYASLIITRKLAGRDLPYEGDGSNNTFTITPVDSLYASIHSHYHFADVDVYIPEKSEYEPARVLTTIFSDEHGQFYELTVATPTFEKSDLFGSVLMWIVILYVLLLLTGTIITVAVFYSTMRPLYALLNRIDEYIPGKGVKPIGEIPDVDEFRKLYKAFYGAMERSENLFARQSQFIGDASHELQTPLAIIGNRVEWLLDSTSLSEQQAVELYKINSTLGRAIRLNKTLLLLTKIENGQFPETSQVDIVPLLHDHVESCAEVYSSYQLDVAVSLPESFVVQVNESLISTLIANLVKNLYLHTPQGGKGNIYINDNALYFTNDGDSVLDSERLFDRFYHSSKRASSTGLGLALVSSICKYYEFKLSYDFLEGKHRFIIEF